MEERGYVLSDLEECERTKISSPGDAIELENVSSGEAGKGVVQRIS